ncbi:MAG: thiamine phosphate synthase [Phycisphaeraceae bacterium]|nr:thiamine phosphate synthase [Phycisphaeraceae bacterium]
MDRLLRMIDANANRAAEGLRTLEDLVRFSTGASGSLTRRLKALRHALRNAMATLDPLAMAAWRDAAGDPGAPGQGSEDAVTASAERGESRGGLESPTRRHALDIALAAGSRVGEALRALEEALRAIAPVVAGRVERLRFEAYELSAKVTLLCGSGSARQWRCCLLLTELLCRRPWREVLHAALRAGADCVQVREKSMADGALLERVREVVRAAQATGAAVIVNDRPDLAVASGCDGVHLGSDDLPIRDARRVVGRLLIGASTHDLDEAAHAVEAGADYCGVGAMFPTSTRPDRTPTGVPWLKAFLEHHPRVPHLAIGGITPARIAELAAAGCRGVAVSSAICAAEDPGEVTAHIVSALTAPLEVSR